MEINLFVQIFGNHLTTCQVVLRKVV